MFGLGDDEESQRLRNFLIFKLYLSDAEMEEAAPWTLGILAIVGLIALILWLV